MPEKTADDLWKPDVCVYHGGNCSDGFGAAWAVWKRWGYSVRYVPAQYGTPINWGRETPRGNILFVDFSLPQQDLAALIQRGAQSIVVLDHHKTAQAELEPFTIKACAGGPAFLLGQLDDLPGYFRDLAELDRPPIVAFFDMDKSGARMAWEFCHTDAMPELLHFIEDRDLWRFNFGLRTRKVTAALRLYAQEFELWETLSVESLVNEGNLVLKADEAHLNKILQQAYVMQVGKWRVPTVNAPYAFASEAAERLLKANPDAPFAMSWFRRADGRNQYSLRSEDHRVDVSDVAKQFGGGGHRNAAGFEVSL